MAAVGGGEGFNPHRPFRAGATGNDRFPASSKGRFQSSPALSGRCNQSMPGIGSVQRQLVSILTGPFGPVQRAILHLLWLQSSFNPHRPFRAGATWHPVDAQNHVAVVSILTGPFGPVQRGHRKGGEAEMNVSILTGPFGPVQRLEGGSRGDNARGFNPHRPFRAGATRRLGYAGPRGRGFNPHRPFRAGATVGPCQSRPALMPFQSSPALSGRCNPRPTPTSTPTRSFQSSPALSGRCNSPLSVQPMRPGQVSILTGPFGPVQPRRLLRRRGC